MPPLVLAIILVMFVLLLKWGVIDLSNAMDVTRDRMNSIAGDSDGSETDQIHNAARRCAGNFTILNKIIGCSERE